MKTCLKVIEIIREAASLSVASANKDLTTNKNCVKRSNQGEN